MDPAVLIFETAAGAAEACGDRTLELLDQARRERGSATIALSGGNTPKPMFQAMAKRRFDWSGIRFYQVDERCVPAEDEQSNFRMIRQFLLEPAGIDPGQFHRVPTELPPVEAASAYEDEIRRTMNVDWGGLPVFDIVQRGMGPDAHTASLFPGDPAITDREGNEVPRAGIAAARWVEKFHQHRVTLLPRILEAARCTLCLVTGADKADALRKVLDGPYDPLHLPAQISSEGMARYLDRAAAASIRSGG